MKRVLLILSFLLFFALVQGEDYIKIDDIEPGMKGYGFSVFKGWEPEKFDVEIIDVMKNASPKRSFILARLKGQNLEYSGVIAGMSGSPVYVNDKLIGAVAYTWSFSKEPICGITPLENMLEEKKYTKKATESQNNDRFFKKITTPVFINGFSGFAKTYLEEFFKTKFQESSILLESSRMDENALKSTGKKIRAGDAVAINLVEGDLNVQAIGTVTYVSNDDIFIFGHPLNEDGFISLPISKAYIFTVIPSSYLSFKIGASSTPIGSAIYDGQNAVYCKYGSKADMIPFHLKITEGNTKNSYRYNIVDNKNYFPSLATASLIACLLNQTGYMDEKRFTLSFRIGFKSKNKHYQITNEIIYSYYPSFYNFMSLASDLNSFFSIFYYNELSDLKITGCYVDIKIDPEVFYYVIENAGIDKRNYEAGESIRLKVVLKAFKSDYITKFIYLNIPENLKSGQYNIILGSEAGVFNELRRSFPYFFQISSVEDLVYWGSYRIDPANLVAAIVVPKQGVVIRDKRLTSFPEIYTPFFQSTTEKTYLPVFPEVFTQTIKMDGVIFNSLKLQFNVGQVKTERQE